MVSTVAVAISSEKASAPDVETMKRPAGVKSERDVLRRVLIIVACAKNIRTQKSVANTIISLQGQLNLFLLQIVPYVLKK